jgi:polyhydroxyalkanoate synthesis regulator phasin
MAKNDLFRRSLEVGTSIVDLTRERAEAVVKDWVEAGDLGRGKAKKAVDELLDRSHRAGEELQGFVRREIGDQLAALGVATRDDLARLEAKIETLTAAAKPAARTSKSAGAKAKPAGATPPGPTPPGPTPPGAAQAGAATGASSPAGTEPAATGDGDGPAPAAGP